MTHPTKWIHRGDDTLGVGWYWSIWITVEDSKHLQVCYGHAGGVREAQTCAEVVFDSLRDRGLKSATVQIWDDTGERVEGTLTPLEDADP